MNEISSVIPLENYMLSVIFNNGEIKTFDVKPYLKYDIFEPLQDVNQFKKVYVGEFTQIVWECGAELSPDTIYLKGETDEISVT